MKDNSEKSKFQQCVKTLKIIAEWEETRDNKTEQSNDEWGGAQAFYEIQKLARETLKSIGKEEQWKEYL